MRRIAHLLVVVAAAAGLAGAATPAVASDNPLDWLNTQCVRFPCYPPFVPVEVQQLVDDVLDTRPGPTR